MTETRDFFTDLGGTLVVVDYGRSVSDAPKTPCSSFNPKTFDDKLDKPRLNAQQGRVLAFMQDGGWHSLREISEATGDPEASVSARLRDLRKPKFGMFTVKHRRRGNPSLGVWEYSISNPAI